MQNDRPLKTRASQGTAPPRAARSPAEPSPIEQFLGLLARLIARRHLQAPPQVAELPPRPIKRHRPRRE